jgi:hypothetical protein
MLFANYPIPDGSPELLPVMLRNSFSLQGLGIVNVIALLLALMLHTPSAHAQ